MRAITVRHLSPETHQALRERAARHHRSTEAEVRAILDAAADDGEKEGLGTLLARVGREAGVGVGAGAGAARGSHTDRRDPSDPVRLPAGWPEPLDAEYSGALIRARPASPRPGRPGSTHDPPVTEGP